MTEPARTIWDTKIQAVCAVVAAQDGEDVELWMCANFGQVSLDPPRIIVNPNRLYPIEGAVRRAGRFSINVLPESELESARRMTEVRRRSPRKAAVLGLQFSDDAGHGIPYLPRCLQTLFCETEQILDTGDHTVMIARVLESRTHAQRVGERPLLYPRVTRGTARYPWLSAVVRQAVVRSGAKEKLKRALGRGRAGEAPVDLAGETYRQGGQTEKEIAEIVRHGLSDQGRVLEPPSRATGMLRRRIGVCVVGLGQWGSFHCRLFREANPLVDLYVCGRDPARVAQVARRTGAKGFVIGLEKAVEDSRFEAMSLVLPHHLHAGAALLALAHGKHVMVEKPIATSLEDADTMILAARKAGVVLRIAEDMHFRPAVREAAAAIARGDVGEPLYFTAHGGGMVKLRGWKADSERMGGGVLMDLGVHYVRAMRLLMGEPDHVQANRAMQVDTRMGGEDSVHATFSSRYGWQAHFLLSWAGPRGHSPDMIISGERGVIHLWPGAGFYDWYPAAPRPIPRALSYLRPGWLGEKLTRPEMQRVRRRIADEDKLGYHLEVREFLAAITEQREAVSAPEHARRDLEIVLCGYEALRSGHWTEIPKFGAGYARGAAK